MTHLTPLKTTIHGHTISRYNGGAYQGYVVTARIASKPYSYDFMDNRELALEYLEALDEVYVIWSRAVKVADAAIARGWYERLVTKAKHQRWDDDGVLEQLLD